MDVGGFLPAKPLPVSLSDGSSLKMVKGKVGNKQTEVEKAEQRRTWRKASGRAGNLGCIDGEKFRMLGVDT